MCAARREPACACVQIGCNLCRVSMLHTFDSAWGFRMICGTWRCGMTCVVFAFRSALADDF